MAYFATWLRDEEILAEDQFHDLVEAQAAVLERMPEFHQRGANRVRVWDERKTYVAID